MEILIDLKSIKKNPNARNTSSNVLVGERIYFESEELVPEDIADGVNIVCLDSYQSENLCTMFLLLKDKEQAGKLKGFKGVFRVSRESKELCHAPEPEYLFEYEDTNVKCSKCSREFSHNLLESDSYGFACSSCICPYCETWDCCFVEYERIENALIRRGK